MWRTVVDPVDPALLPLSHRREERHVQRLCCREVMEIEQGPEHRPPAEIPVIDAAHQPLVPLQPEVLAAGYRGDPVVHELVRSVAVRQRPHALAGPQARQQGLESGLLHEEPLRRRGDQIA